jgi:hypothetical protein
MKEQARRAQRKDETIKKGKLRLAIEAKEKFILQYGWDHPSRLSFYADRIAGLLPANTLLTSMKINPRNNSSFGYNTQLTFKNDTIQIMGTCEDPTDLNKFTNNLKNMQNFKAVNVKNYSYKKELQSGSFLMEIITN